MAGAGPAEITPEIQRAIDRNRALGSELDHTARAQMEKALGADLSGVRIHTGPEADALNRSLEARAFTTGRDIFFANGEYSPGTSHGVELIAHELTHVVQQGGAAAMPVQTSLVLGWPDDAYECEAQALARQVATGELAGEAPSVARTATVQRQAAPQPAQNPSAAPAPKPFGPEIKAQPPAPPKFTRSPGKPLPGDPVPGVPQKKGTYTAEDRKLLFAALGQRHQQNATRGLQFVNYFVSALVEVWSAYITDFALKEMVKTGQEMVKSVAEQQEKSTLLEVFGFVVREALIAVIFPEVEIERLTAKAAYWLAEKGTAVTFELMQGRLTEPQHLGDKERNEIEKRARELKDQIAEQTGAVAELSGLLTPVVQEMTDDFDYSEWLGEASLDKLKWFRLPPAFPATSRAHIGGIVADAIIGVLTKDISVADVLQRGYGEYSVNVSFFGPGRSDYSVYGSFLGPEAFKKELQGLTIREAANVPLAIVVTGPHRDKEYDFHEIPPLPGENWYIDSDDPHYQEKSEKRSQAFWLRVAMANVLNSWRQRTPLSIIRAHGDILVSGGSLQENFQLYEWMVPEADLLDMVMEAARLLPAWPEAAAQYIYNKMEPELKEGAAFFIRSVVEPKLNFAAGPSQPL